MSKTKLAVFIDGGLGRVLCAIPALKELAKTNELKVLTGGWRYAYIGSGLDVVNYGEPEMESTLDGFKIVKPEPYWNLGFREGKLNLVEAFYEELGLTVPKDAVPYTPDLRQVGARIHSERPILMLQPHGSGGEADPRSMMRDEVSEVIEKYSKEYAVFIIGTEVDFGFEPEKVQQIKDIPESAFIRYLQKADMIVSCDSCGLHLAAAGAIPHIAYLKTTSGIKYYKTTSKVVHPEYKGMRVNPRL